MTRLTVNRSLVLVAWIVVAALLGPAGVGAQQSPAPGEVDKIFAAFDNPGSPGCALGVVRDGQIIYERGYGRAELEWDIPITPTTVFNVGSVSKQFTAAAIALLAERGKLSLDDDVRKHIPELPLYEAPITIRQLLHHTSGVRDLLELMMLAGKDINTHYRSDEYVALLARQKELNFRPGSQHLYSNSGYLMLGVIVQRVSGMSLREFSERNIFGPLGMKDTHFHDDNRMVIPRRAQAYAPRSGGFVLDYSTNFDRVGPGGVNTTIRDMVLWDRSFDTGALGGPSFRSTMLTRGVLTTGDTIPYALALVHGEQGGLPTISHGGSSLGFRAHYLRFPEQHFSAITLCNTPTNPARFTAQVAQLYLTNVLKPQVATATPTPPAPRAAEPAEVAMSAADLQRYAGDYWSEEAGARIGLAMKDGKLVVRRPGVDDLPVVPIGAERFRAPFGTIEFARAAEIGSPFEFRLQGGRMKNLLFRRVN